MGDTIGAFALYDQAIEIDPNNVSILNNYAYFLTLCNRDLDKAERMSAKTVQAEPQNATFLDTYAWVFYKRKEYTMAQLYIEMAIKNERRPSSDIYDHYGDILLAVGNKQEALKQWKKPLNSMLATRNCSKRWKSWLWNSSPPTRKKTQTTNNNIAI